jgi:hypothetical protein
MAVQRSLEKTVGSRILHDLLRHRLAEAKRRVQTVMLTDAADSAARASAQAAPAASNETNFRILSPPYQPPSPTDCPYAKLA